MESMFRSGQITGDIRFRRVSHISQEKQKMAVAPGAIRCKRAAGKGYMGKKDLAGKDFFADRKRFAELLNVVIYQGKEVICAEGIEYIHRRYPSFSGNGEMSRDILMKDRERNIYYGLELETESDYSMPERVMVYDACEFEHRIKGIRKRKTEERQKEEKLDYREKKSRMGESDFLLPVVTVVLYLGTGHFEGRQKLSELYNIPKEMQNILGDKLPDYKFTLAEADFLDAGAFKTDLKDFFTAMQCRNDKTKLKELIKTERFLRMKEDTAWAVAIYLDRKSLTEKIKKEGLTVCKALDELLKDERMEGKSEGRMEGERKERISIVRNMVREGMDYELIRKITGCTAKELSMAVE